MTTRSKTQGKGSVSHQADLDTQAQGESLDPEEKEVLFKLALEQALGDPQIQARLKATVQAANHDLLEAVSSLRDEVRSLRSSLADRDATIAALQSEVQVLQEDYDALEHIDMAGATGCASAASLNRMARTPPLPSWSWRTTC